MLFPTFTVRCFRGPLKLEGLLEGFGFSVSGGVQGFRA